MTGATVAYAVGILQVALALVIGRRLGRLGRQFPWLGVLTVFFALRGVTRLAETAAGRRVDSLAEPVDALLVVALVLLIIGFDRTIRGLLLAQDAARYREQEYTRGARRLPAARPAPPGEPTDGDPRRRRRAAHASARRRAAGRLARD